MAPSEMVDASCNAVAPALALAAAVVIEEFEGVPWSISWTTADMDWEDISSAERSAWLFFAQGLSGDPWDHPALAAPALSSGRVEWRAIALAPPLNGIFYCETCRALDDDDLALLSTW